MKQASEPGGAPALAQIELIKVADIVPDPKNRKDHDQAELQSLAGSIAAEGLLQPIVVRATGPAKYTLIAGERRWLAHKLLARPEIPARVMGAVGENGVGATRKRLAENFHRVDLSPIEKARDLEQLFKEGMTTAEVVTFVGAKDQSTVSNMMRLLKLPKKVQDWLQDGSINAAQGKALLRFEGKNKLIEAIAERAIDEGASSKALEKGLPFAAQLAEDSFVHDFEWSVRTLKELPATYQADPDFLEAEGEYGEKSVFCVDPVKGAAAQKVIDAEREVRRAKQASAGSSGDGRSASVMSPAELAERKKKMEKNKSARAAIDGAFSRAAAYLKSSRSFEVLDSAVRTVLGVATESYQHSQRLKTAAEGLGLTIGKDGLKELSPTDGIRVAAMAILLRQCDDAKRFAGDVPEAAKQLTGGRVQITSWEKPPAKHFKAAAKKLGLVKSKKTAAVTAASILAKVAKKGRK